MIGFSKLDFCFMGPFFQKMLLAQAVCAARQVFAAAGEARGPGHPAGICCIPQYVVGLPANALPNVSHSLQAWLLGAGACAAWHVACHRWWRWWA